MKRMLIYLAIGVFLAGLTGVSHAQRYNAREDCSTEGPPYIRDVNQLPDIPTKVVLYQESRYIEGMGFAPPAEGQKTILSKYPERYDFCSEGFSEEELQYMYHMREIERIVPAAGRVD